MKFTDKYSLSNPKIGLRIFLRRKKKRLKLRFKEIGITPIDSAVSTCTIVGCGHSGTSLIAGRLSRHSSLEVIGYETGLFFPTKNLYQSKKTLLTHLARVQTSKKLFLIEKTPKHIHSYRRILKLFPQNYFICIARNPLDTIASLYKRIGDLQDAIDRWNIDNQELLKYHHRHPSLIIKYEELVSNPEKGFKKICSFLNISYVNEVLESGETCYNNEESLPDNMLLRRQQVSNPIQPRINTWSEVLTIAEASNVLEHTHIISEQLGYNFDNNYKLI